jgi:hypothetical protein
MFHNSRICMMPGCVISLAISKVIKLVRACVLPLSSAGLDLVLETFEFPKASEVPMRRASDLGIFVAMQRSRAICSAAGL